MKYLHQTGDRIVEYNDAPLKVDGIRYVPRWAWSADYRKWFRQGHARGRMSLKRVDQLNRRWGPDARFGPNPILIGTA